MNYRQNLRQLFRKALNGDSQNRVGSALHFSVPGTVNKQVISGFRSQLAISTGAACSSGVEQPSHVLKAMNLPSGIIDSALRLSLGRFSTKADVAEVANILVHSYA